MAGAVFGDVELSLFVAGAVFGEIWNDSRSAKCCIFQYKVTSVARRVADDGFMVGSSSDPARIILGMVSDRSRIVIDVSSVLEKCF